MYTPRYLQDFCALILTGVTLYDGLAINEGIVAVYGKGDFAHSLSMHGIIKSKKEMDDILFKDIEFPIEKKKYPPGLIHTSVCVPKDLGAEGLELYLKSRGFKAGDHNYEKQAAIGFIEKCKRRHFISRYSLLGYENLDYKPELGREIAAAVTTGQVQLFGKYNSAASTTKRKTAKYRVEVSSPLRMGILKFRAKINLSGYRLGLVFINGMLRVLATKTGGFLSDKEPIWDIIPKLDATENFGSISREDMDFIFYYYYDCIYSSIETDINQNVLLGLETILVDEIKKKL